MQRNSRTDAQLAHGIGQEIMRGMHTISTQPNPQPMPGPCIDIVDEETTRIRIDQYLEKCIVELIRMVYASNNKPMPNVQVSTVLEIHGQSIIANF